MKLTLAQWTILITTLRNSLDLNSSDFSFGHDLRRQEYIKIMGGADKTSFMFRTQLVPTTEITEDDR